MPEDCFFLQWDMKNPKLIAFYMDFYFGLVALEGSTFTRIFKDKGNSQVDLWSFRGVK